MNRIEVQADEFQKLLEMIEEHQGGSWEEYQHIKSQAQRKAEQIDALRLADLERQSNV